MIHIALVSTLCKKFKKAKIGVKDTSEAYQDLSKALDKGLVQTWQKDEQKAQVERGEALRIYDVQLEQGMESLSIYSKGPTISLFYSTLPGRH